MSDKMIYTEKHQKIVEQINGLIKELSEVVSSLPDNPDIHRVQKGSKAYVISFSKLSGDRKLSVFFYDYQAQYKWVVDRLPEIPFTEIEGFLQKIIKSALEDKPYIYKAEKLYFNPGVAEQLKKLL